MKKVDEAALEEIHRLRARLREVEFELQDWRDGATRVANEQCAPDEKHCACVPALRKKLREVEKQRTRWLDRAVEVQHERTMWRQRAEKAEEIVNRLKGEL